MCVKNFELDGLSGNILKINYKVLRSEICERALKKKIQYETIEKKNEHVKRVSVGNICQKGYPHTQRGYKMNSSTQANTRLDPCQYHSPCNELR